MQYGEEPRLKSDNISKLIIKIYNQISILLTNRDLNINMYNELINLKSLNQLTSNEKEKQDYIEFVLLTLYTELNYYLHERSKYVNFMKNKSKQEKDLDELKRCLKFTNNTISKYESLISETRSKDYDEPFKRHEIIPEVSQEITEYKKQTQNILDTLQRIVLSPSYDIEFTDFYTREQNKISVVKHVITRYICLITQICFGKETKKKHHLFFDILKILSNDNDKWVLVEIDDEKLDKPKYIMQKIIGHILWGEYDYRHIRDVVRPINIDNSVNLKICFQGFISTVININLDQKEFNKLKSLNHFNSNIIDRYESFMFNNMFYKDFLQFIQKVRN